MEKYKEYEDTLKTRYIQLYGNTDCEAWILKERRKIVFLLAVFIILVFILICNDISAAKKEYSNVQFNKNGQIIGVTRPKDGEDSYSFNTKVKIMTDEGVLEEEYYITIEPAGQSEQESEQEDILKTYENNSAEEELKKLISGLNEDTGVSVIQLPRTLAGGESVIWMKADNTDPVIYILGALMALLFLYHNRFYMIAREEKKARESIIKELPEFINKIVLLINAGVILNTAFLKVADDCDETTVKRSYFYRRIKDIGNLVRETNASLHHELYTFAKHSGVKELMRITNIILENIDKGDDLSDKLRRENEILWFARKQQAEEKGRLAETKLTLPLMILLTVLIMVTIAPALMEM